MTADVAIAAALLVFVLAAIAWVASRADQRERTRDRERARRLADDRRRRDDDEGRR